MSAPVKPDRPAARVPGILAGELAQRERARTRAELLAHVAEAGLFAASAEHRRRRERLDALEGSLRRALDLSGPENEPARIAELVAARDALEALRPSLALARGSILGCRQCGQVGRAVALLDAGRVRWEWSGRDATGAIVHPCFVHEARPLGDQPPWLCPDHEPGPRGLGRIELTRGSVR